MKKSETVAMLRDAFLAGKDVEAIKKFDAKDLEKQYIAVMNWKRRQNLTTNTSVKDVINLLKKAHKSLAGLEALSPKDSQKLHAAIDDFKSSMENFEKLKKQQLINQLKSEKERLLSKGQSLDKKIEALQQELG